jgi:adenine-specific DNA-methyltransferase
MDFVRISASKNSIILDFFAGSGTTLHATMQLNAEDGGLRQCILVTNNENGICEQVTYERNKRVIEGYTTPKGQAVEGLSNNNLRYYRTDFISRERTQRNMRALVNAATDLLCIKEDLYEEKPLLGTLKLKPQLARYFSDGQKHMLVVYREEVVKELVEAIKTLELGKSILKIYIFSPGRYAFDDDFYEVQDKVQLVALPAAIYDAYQRVLPKQKECLLVEAEDPAPRPTASVMTIDFEEGGEQ